LGLKNIRGGLVDDIKVNEETQGGISLISNLIED
jgi:hypothetical protein